MQELGDWECFYPVRSGRWCVMANHAGLRELWADERCLLGVWFVHRGDQHVIVLAFFAVYFPNGRV